MRLLVTRPQPEAGSFAQELQALGQEPVLAPLLAIEAGEGLPASLFGEIDAIALTSARALACLAPPLEAFTVPLFAVGPASAAAAREAGFAQVEQAGGDARSLARLLRRRLPAGVRLLHPSGADQARDLGALLSGSRLRLDRRIVYRAETAKELPAAAAVALRDAKLDGATFFSPRTARTFVRLVQDSGLATRTGTLFAFCLSPAVAAGLTGSAWREIRSAARPDRAGLLETIMSRSCGGGSVMTTKKIGRSRRTAPTSGRTRSRRAKPTTTASATAADSVSEDPKAQDQAEAAKPEAGTSDKDSVGVAGAAKEALGSSESGDAGSESTLTSAAGDSLADSDSKEAEGSDNKSGKDSDEAATVNVISPAAHRLTAADILSEDNLAGSSTADSLATRGTSAPLIDVTTKEVQDNDDDSLAVTASVDTAATDSDDTTSGSETPTAASDTDKSDTASDKTEAESPSATSGGGSGGGFSSQPPASPPPLPLLGGRRSGLLKGVAMGGVLVALGYILAVGTSDLWLGKVVTPDDWGQQIQKIDALTKTADAAQKAADDAGQQLQVLGKHLDELAKGASLPKAQLDAIDGLEKARKALTTEIAGLTKQIGDLGKRVDALAKVPSSTLDKDAVKKLNDEIAAAKAAGATLQKQVANALKAQQDKLNTALAGGKDGLTALQKDLSDLQGNASKNLAQLDKRLAKLETAEAPGPEVAKEIEGLRAAVSRMENRSNTLISRLTSDPKALEDGIAGVKSQAEKLVADLAALSEQTAGSLAALGDKTAGAVSNLSAKVGKEVSDLADRLTKEMASLEARAKQTGDSLSAKIEGEIASLSAKLESETAGLSSKLESETARLSAGLTSTERDVTDLKSGLDSTGKSLTETSGDVAENKAQLTALDGKVAGLEKTAPDLQKSLASLQKDSGEVAGRLTKLGEQIDSFAGALNDRIDMAIAATLAKDMRPRAAALALATTSLGDAIRRGGSFAGQFDAVEKLAGSAPELKDDLASLKPLAAAGVSSRGGLISSFDAQIPKILEAASGEMEESGDLLDDAWGAVSGLVEVRLVGEISGDTPKAIVARVRQRLLAGNLTEAISEVAGLKGAAVTAAAPWLTEARARLLALQAAERLQQAALASLAAQQN